MNRKSSRLLILFALLVLVALSAWAGGNKVQICHNFHIINVSENAVQAHLDHGDQLGMCDFCESNPCQNGDCQNLSDGFQCLCLPGWTGTHCEIPIH